MDDPRRRPPPFPPLAVRERGNYISVRERPDSQGGRGTLNRPKPIEMPRLGQQVLHTRLGYEATPSTEVWAFHAPFPLQLQVTRRSEDRAANCVAVALLDEGNRRVAPLVATARGVGLPVTVPAGSYRIIAALGIPEEVTVELEVNVAPPVGLAGSLLARLAGAGSLISTTRRSLSGSARAVIAGGGRVAIRGLALNGVAQAAAGGRLLVRTELLAGVASQGLTASGGLGDFQPAFMAGQTSLAAGGQALLRPVVWRNDPESFWRARRSGETLELNRAYLSTDPALQRQQLEEAGL